MGTGPVAAGDEKAVEAPRRASPFGIPRWSLLFALLATLVAVAIALPIVYNLGQQLRPEQVARAKQQWAATGPADYDLTYSVRYDDDKQAERHVVLVRGGRVVFASCEGQPRYLSPGLAALAGLPAGGVGGVMPTDVPGILAHIEALLTEAKTSGRRDFLVAAFHGEDGHPRRFIRRQAGTRTREEWDIRVWPAGTIGEGPGGTGGRGR